MEFLVENRLYTDMVHLNNHKISNLTPEPQFSQFLAKLGIQDENNLIMLPKYLYHNMSSLLVLDLSHTSIQSLPPSISMLCSLEEFILQDCSLLIELPPEIGALKNLKLFDLEGTEIMYLPKEIGKLRALEHLRVFLSTFADDYKNRNGIQHIIPRMTILKLTNLKELSINVSSEAEWWEVELLEAIIYDLVFLPDLKTLKLYLPTDKALQQFLKLERYKVPIYSSLWNYRFMTGYCEELPLSVQLDIEENFLKLGKCVKYMNGEGYNDEIVKLISDADALYLRRHWTVENLSMFDIRKLKYCLLMECNEMQTLFDQEDFCQNKNKTINHCEEDDEIFGSLQYLSIHFLKKLQSISKGPIGKNSLSCLRILALHTCPELTSVFTESLLDNLQCLTEIIVEDCPKVNCLVTLESTRWSYDLFLPNLRRVSLLDLPELVSVSGGVFIAPQLDTLLVFNCMKLEYLSVMEIPRDIMEIRGEIEWWDALRYGKLTWESVFVPLKRDGKLMDQLAEDTNSLQHFLELEMVPSLPGQVNQNSSRDTKEGRKRIDQFQFFHTVDVSNDTRKKSTSKIFSSNNVTHSHDAKTAFRMWDPPSPLSSKPDNKDTYCVSKDPDHKLASTKKKSRSIDIAKRIQKVKANPYDVRKYLQNESHKYRSRISSITLRHHVKVKVNKGIEVEKALDDGYIWRKYGEKSTLGAKFPRTYYRCSFGGMYDCGAKKHVQRSDEDPSVFKIAYSGSHTCPTFLNNKISSIATESTCTTLTPRGSSTAPDSASVITDSHCNLAKRPQVLDSNKLAYNKCNSCDAKKQFQRSDDNSYKDIHTCLRLSVNSNSTCESESALSILKNSDSSTTTEPEFTINSGSTKTESTSTITDNSSAQNFIKKISGSASIQRWKKQTEEIQSPLKFQIPSFNEPNIKITEVEKNGSTNLSSSAKTPLNEKQSPLPVLKVRKEKLGDRVTELQQLVSPFGKVDTASVLAETCDYINFLHEQTKVLMTPFIKQETPLEPKQLDRKQDLRCKGLCLVPVSSTFPVTNQTTTNFASRASGKLHDERNTYKTELFPYAGNSTCESESRLSILKNSDSSTTTEPEVTKYSGSIITESTSSITDNSSGQNLTKKISGNASIQRWKQQTEEIQSLLKSQIPSFNEPNMIISEVEENDNPSSAKTHPNVTQCSTPVLKARKEKLGYRITELQKLVSPFGKADAASVLLESSEYVRFLHSQVKVLMTPYIKQETPLELNQQSPKQDLKSKGLCLIPVSSTFPVTNQTTTDFSSPAIGEPHDELFTYKTELFPYAGNSTCESESTLSILKNSDSSTTTEPEVTTNSGSTKTESTSTITDNSSGQNFTKMSGSSSIQRWKQQAKEIQSPLKLQIPSFYDPNQMIISEVEENCSMNLSSSAKSPLNAKQCPLPVLKVRKEKMGEKITELQQLVSPFGKADTSSVLLETCEYIRFLHEQVEVLMAAYIKQGTPVETLQKAPNQDLRSKGLCLVPSSIFSVTNQTTTDFSAPASGEHEPNA